MSITTSQQDTALAPTPLRAGINENHWNASLGALISAAVLITLVHRETAESMVSIWYRSDTFTHCFLIVPIAIWLAWRRRKLVLQYLIQPWWPALGLILGIGIGWLGGQLAWANAVTQLAFTALLVLTVPLVLGIRIARELAFPLGFLFFAVPIGEFLIPPMMHWTAEFTVLSLRLSGVLVYRDGLQFVLTTGNWSVVEACSGVRYLIGAVTAGTLFAYLNYSDIRRRVLFCLFAASVAIVANWLRAYLIVMLGHFSSNQLATGADHLIYGWIFFGIVIFLTFSLGALWRQERAPANLRCPDPLLAPAPRRAVWLAAFLSVGVSSLAPLYYNTRVIPADMQRDHKNLVIPGIDEGGGWQRIQGAKSPWSPTYLDPSAEAAETFLRDGKAVHLYIAYYRRQSTTRKLIASTNVLVSSKEAAWVATPLGTRSVVLGASADQVQTYLLRTRNTMIGGKDGLLVWKVYWVNGRWTGSDYLARLYGVASRLSGRGDDVAAVFISAANEDQSEVLLESFLAANVADLSKKLELARGSP